ncbi:MAG: hypothetical protein KatS3mg119_2126 [Rhodothalassiaceae bacterium]|nr:MAG: hypothetical protein KatS3mg119_2126 [Rhodothalassiaceae bacterium]
MSNPLSVPLRLALIRLAAVLLIPALWAGAAAAGQHADAQAANTAKVETPSAGVVEDAEALWQLLDYIAVDYAGAVADGKVINPAEYAEMEEFAQLVRRQTQRLEAASPVGAGAGALAPMAEALARAVAEKAPASTVSTLARQLAAALAERFDLTLAPTRAPDLSRAAALYRDNCASCHGAAGAGDGPLAQDMDPPPIAFTDRSRAEERSLASYFATISRGVDGTAMPAFAHLDAQERWALAFHVGGFAYPEGLAAEGRRLWERDRTLRAAIPNLEALTALTPAELAARIGADRTAALLAFLRRHPAAVMAASATTLALARTRLEEALALYRKGDRTAAARAALAAYLDGVEPVEPLLKARAPELVPAIEQTMAAVRRAISNDEGLPALEAAVAAARAELDTAERLLGSTSTADRLTTATAAFTILLREGLEALLLVVAMVTFLAKAGRREMLAWVHGGWIAALAAGFATWLLATRLITISGATRELTEGLGGLLAAIVLVSVGVWMHGRATAAGWQRYIAETMQRALSRRSAWFLAALAFLVVYREAFETILFYVALWSEGQRAAVAGGAAAGAGALFVIALAAVRFARRLPIRAFFVVSSWLIAVLAIVLAGKGVAALQEAGWIGATPLPGLPRIDWVGLFPTRETLFTQLAVVLATFGAFAWQSRREMRRRGDAAAG